MVRNIIEAHRRGAEIYSGNDELCRRKIVELLEELNLPTGLLPLENFEEIGFNRHTGFVWFRQKKAFNYTYPKVGRLVSFDAEVTGFVENRRMRQVNGVKSRELFMWFPLEDFYVDPKSSNKITFKTPAGLSITYPTSAFEPEEMRNRVMKAF